MGWLTSLGALGGTMLGGPAGGAAGGAIGGALDADAAKEKEMRMNAAQAVGAQYAPLTNFKANYSNAAPSMMEGVVAGGATGYGFSQGKLGKSLAPAMTNSMTNSQLAQSAPSSWLAMGGDNSLDNQMKQAGQANLMQADSNPYMDASLYTGYGNA